MNESAKPYQVAVRDAVAIQFVLGILTAITLDGGMLLQMWCFSTAAFWPMAILLLIRSRTKPNRLDPYVIRWAFLILILVVAPLVAGGVWKLQGKL